jgi:hypothetical protein
MSSYLGVSVLLFYVLQILPGHMFFFFLSPLQTLVADFCMPFRLRAISVNSARKFSMRLLLLASLVVASPHAMRTVAFRTFSAVRLLSSICLLPHVCCKVFQGLGLVALAASPAIAIRADALSFGQQPLVMRERRSGFALPAARAALWRTTTLPYIPSVNQVVVISWQVGYLRLCDDMVATQSSSKDV